MNNSPALLPDRWIQRIWDTMRATYGSAFDRMWSAPSGSDPVEHVKGLMFHWAKELGVYSSNSDAIAYALGNLPDLPPNLMQFKALCNRRPEPQRPALPVAEFKLEFEVLACQGDADIGESIEKQAGRDDPDDPDDAWLVEVNTGEGSGKCEERGDEASLDDLERPCRIDEIAVERLFSQDIDLGAEVHQNFGHPGKQHGHCNDAVVLGRNDAREDNGADQAQKLDSPAHRHAPCGATDEGGLKTHRFGWGFGHSPCFGVV